MFANDDGRNIAVVALEPAGKSSTMFANADGRNSNEICSASLSVVTFGVFVSPLEEGGSSEICCTSAVVPTDEER